MSRTLIAVHGGRLPKNIQGTKDAISLYLLFQQVVCGDHLASRWRWALAASDQASQAASLAWPPHLAQHQDRFSYSPFFFFVSMFLPIPFKIMEEACPIDSIFS